MACNFRIGALIFPETSCAFHRSPYLTKKEFNPEFPLENLMEKKQFLRDFCPD